MASGDHFHTPGDQPKAQGQGSVEIERSHCNFQMAQSSPEKLRDVCRAAGTGDIETVNAWLRTAPDVNAQDDKGRPLLLLLVCGTIMARHVDLARKLLALGADVNASNDNRITVLHIASCGRGEDEVGGQRSHLEDPELLAAAAVVDGPRARHSKQSHRFRRRRQRGGTFSQDNTRLLHKNKNASRRDEIRRTPGPRPPWTSASPSARAVAIPHAALRRGP